MFKNDGINYRVAFYLRAEPGEVDSLSFQKLLLERFVAHYGQLSKASIELYSDYCDSTFNLGPEHERLTQDVKGGKIDVVIVADIGRICRCGLEIEAFLNLMEKSHFRFISVGDNLDINGWSELGPNFDPTPNDTQKIIAKNLTLFKNHLSLPSELRAVLTIFAADNELSRKALPHVDIERREIDWDEIYANDFGGGHAAALSWSKAIWCDQVSTKSDPFDRAFAMDTNLQAAVLKALAIRWGLS